MYIKHLKLFLLDTITCMFKVQAVTVMSKYSKLHCLTIITAGMYMCNFSMNLKLEMNSCCTTVQMQCKGNHQHAIGWTPDVKCLLQCRFFRGKDSTYLAWYLAASQPGTMTHPMDIVFTEC